jgi:hypothetical protein
VLGFKMLWDSPSFASVKRDGCEIFLSEGDQGHFGGWVWIGVSNVDDVLPEYQRSGGAKIRHAPTNYWWARPRLARCLPFPMTSDSGQRRGRDLCSKRLRL